MQILINYINARIRISHVIAIWLLVNLVSAFFTPLYSDEAYYALFARNLDFGYFDHPPMIALMIRIGLSVFNNEFGVRLLSVIAVAVALYFIYKLAEVHKPLLFLVCILSIFGLNVLGFLALPDSPLLLFSVLFFIVYKRFLAEENYPNSLLLGLIMALMLYSKYHGILIIIFTIISNLKLLRSYKFYISAVVALLLFIPHILWQLNNDFVTISYHLFERSASVYKGSFTFEYLSGQMLYYGPISMVFLLITAVTVKHSGLFERALIWNLWGFLGFFLIGTLKGRVEVNWTFPVLIPLLIFFLKSGCAKPVIEKWFYILAFPVIILIILLRLQAIYPVFNIDIDRINDFRGQRELGKEVIEKCDGLPLVTNTYQKAGLISFYSNTFVPSINVNSRRNQFNLWHSDNSLRFKKVAFINNYLDEGVMLQNRYYEDYKVSIIDSLPVMNDILIKTELKSTTVNHGETVEIKTVLSSDNPAVCYHDTRDFKTRLHAGLFKDNLLVKEEVCSLPVDILLKRDKGEYDCSIIAPSQRGKYKIVVSLNTTKLGEWSTRKTISLTVR
jgi:hypothetical protein